MLNVISQKIKPFNPFSFLCMILFDEVRMKSATKKFSIKSNILENICKASENRKGIIIYNDSLNKIKLYFDEATEHAFILTPNSYWESSNEFFARTSLSIKATGRDNFDQSDVRVTVFK